MLVQLRELTVQNPYGEYVWAYMEDHSQRAINWKQEFMSLFWSDIDVALFVSINILKDNGHPIDNYQSWVKDSKLIEEIRLIG